MTNNDEGRSGGWKLVPVEPTEAMLNAAEGSGIFLNMRPEGWRRAYEVMLAAAPTLSPPQGGDAVQALDTWLTEQIGEASVQQRYAYSSRDNRRGERLHARHCALADVQLKLRALHASPPSSRAEVVEALVLAEDVLSRFPYSAELWPNGVHPQTGIEKIRAAIRTLAQQEGE